MIKISSPFDIIETNSILIDLIKLLIKNTNIIIGHFRLFITQNIFLLVANL